MMHVIYLGIIFVLLISVWNGIKEFRHWHQAYMNSANEVHTFRAHNQALSTENEKLKLGKQKAEEEVVAWKKVLSDHLEGLERAFRIIARKYDE
jgi:hypothetical protein